MLAAMPDSAPSPVSAGGPALRGSGDACPGTLRLHRADDGALARVRVPGGVLGADRADALLAAAERFGDGELHLTSRGNVQLRGLDAACGGALAELLTAAGLLPSAAHERARNIVASPLAGLDGSPPVSGWLSELDALVCGSPAAASLSGRFLFALDDGRGDVDALGADVTLIAAEDSCLLRIGAEDEVVRIPGGEGPRAALLAAGIFLRAARDTGAWRVKDLPDDVRAGVRADVRAELVRTVGAAAVPRPRPRTATPPPRARTVPRTRSASTYPWGGSPPPSGGCSPERPAGTATSCGSPRGAGSSSPGRSGGRRTRPTRSPPWRRPG